MKLTQLLYNEFKKSYYKSCGDYIIVLKKCIDTVCNENTLYVYDNNNATYRANKMLIYNIIHKLDNSCISQIFSNKVLYEKYKVIEFSNYNDIDINGIEYYTNYNRALFEENNVLLNIKYTGYYVQYDTFGQKLQEGNYINGNKNGKWILYQPLNIINNNNNISFYQALQLTYYHFFGNNNYNITLY